MGIAIINEVMKPGFTTNLIEPLRHEENPLDAIYHLMHRLLLEDDSLKVECGCPAANFTQEMTPWNTNFSNALNEIMQQWIKTMAGSVEKGKKNGLVRKEVNAKQVTLFVLSGYWGVRNFGKLENSKKVFLIYLKELKTYLEVSDWGRFHDLTGCTDSITVINKRKIRL